MELRTMTDLGALVRSVRKNLDLTQSELAARMGVTQSWVSRLERGNPRLEAQLVLDALAVLGVPLSATEHVEDDSDPFAEVFDNLGKS